MTTRWLIGSPARRAGSPDESGSRPDARAEDLTPLETSLETCPFNGSVKRYSWQALRLHHESLKDQKCDMNNIIQECYQHYRNLRQEMDGWLKQSMLLDPPGSHGGGEDEANYALPWFPHYLVTGNASVLQHFETLKSALAGWVKRECLHGYEPEAEAHHGTEPFLLFLPRYIGLAPDDEEAVSLLKDAAEHIGNWVEEIPAWYDYEHNTFYGYYIGTRTVRKDEEAAYEVAEHFRFIHIALAAYRVTGEGRYLDWSLRYGRKRAERIIAAESPMPVMWDLDGNGFDEAEADARGLRVLAGGNHHIAGDPLAGVEDLLASGAIYALGDLYLLSGHTVFKAAAKRIVEPLVDSLLEPYSDPGVAAIGYYRWTFQDTDFDSQIREKLEAIPSSLPAQLALIFPQEVKRREPGVGRRRDMVYWGEWSGDGSVKPIQEPSTAALTLAYQVTGNPEFAMRAFRSASTRLAIARRGLRGGREHADMGGAICSVAAGHGRNWGQGAVTACYGPLLLGTREIQNAVVPTLELRYEEDEKHLPSTLLSLIRPGVNDSGEVLFYNGDDSSLSFSWRACESSTWNDLSLKAGEVKRISFVTNHATDCT